jgi:hypothetical protein
MNSANEGDKYFALARSVKRYFIPQHIVRKSEIDADEENEFGQLTYYPGKQVRPSPVLTKRSIVAVVIGQSNAANTGGQRTQGSNDSILNYWDGQYYVASDPLLGSTGLAGSVWLIAANKLIEKNMADTIVLLPAAVSATSVKQWRNDGQLFAMLENRLLLAKQHGVKVTHFLWHQGETDNSHLIYKSGGVGLVEYERGMKELIALTKTVFPQSKFILAIATRCGVSGPPDSKLQMVQKSLTSMDGVFMGPNTDTIDSVDRYDDCHFAGSGMVKHADGWVEAISSTLDAQ